MRAAVLMLAGCGRVAFNPLGDAGATTDTVTDTALPDGPAVSGLVAYWQFDTPPTGAIPDVIGVHDASCLTSGCPTSVAGHRGQAFMFAGANDCLTVPDPGAFQLPQLTLSLWANLTMLQVGSPISKLVGPASGNANSWQLETDDGARGVLDGISFTTSPHGFLWSPVSALSLTQWHHLAATFDGTNLVLYIDGVVKATATSGPLNYDSGAVWIGCDQNASSATYEYFQGGIDEVQIYNRALTSAEIQSLAAS
jgi:hypothetical protein